jgi:hypothetical protein
MIASPPQSDPQNLWRNILVYAHNKGLVVDFFHVWSFFWLTFAPVLQDYGVKRSFRALDSQLLKNGDGLKRIPHPQRSGIVRCHA